MKMGAFDYLVKPVENARFISSITKALQIFTLKNQMALLEQQLFTGSLEHPDAFSSMVGVSKKMQTVFQYCEVIGSSRQPVLITGETGTGKELLARSIHTVSGVRGKFVPVNVAGLDDNLFTDCLFGHRKGAFTGADEARNGLIESAGSQVKLLRLLQEQEYYPVGSDIPKKSSARVIASTNKNVCEAVKRGTFRNDLYYRICAHRILLPPLRERPEDIPLLVEHFLRTTSQKLGKRRPSPAPQLFPLLCCYSFPGNVRELEAMVFDAVARHQSGVLSLASFKEAISRENAASFLPVQGNDEPDTFSAACSENFPTLKDSETHLVSEALRRAGGNQGIAASLLGISRSALNKRLRKKG
jgi:DNA-binding NtrC family response regulator